MTDENLKEINLEADIESSLTTIKVIQLNLTER